MGYKGSGGLHQLEKQPPQLSLKTWIKLQLTSKRPKDLTSQKVYTIRI